MTYFTPVWSVDWLDGRTTMEKIVRPRPNNRRCVTRYRPGHQKGKTKQELLRLDLSLRKRDIVRTHGENWWATYSWVMRRTLRYRRAMETRIGHK